jgi:hypothetical protein
MYESLIWAQCALKNQLQNIMRILRLIVWTWDNLGLTCVLLLAAVPVGTLAPACGQADWRIPTSPWQLTTCPSKTHSLSLTSGVFLWKGKGNETSPEWKPRERSGMWSDNIPMHAAFVQVYMGVSSPPFETAGWCSSRAISTREPRVADGTD